MPSRSSIFSVTVEPSLRKGPAQENVKNEAHPTRPPLSIASARALLFCFPLSFSSSSSCWPLETVGASRSAPCCSCDAIFVERERVVVNGAFVRGRSRTSAKRAVSANRAQMQPTAPSGSLPPQRKKAKLCGGLSDPPHGPCSAKDTPYWYLVVSTKVREVDELRVLFLFLYLRKKAGCKLSKLSRGLYDIGHDMICVRYHIFKPASYDMIYFSYQYSAWYITAGILQKKLKLLRYISHAGTYITWIHIA